MHLYTFMQQQYTQTSSVIFLHHLCCGLFVMLAVNSNANACSKHNEHPLHSTPTQPPQPSPPPGPRKPLCKTTECQPHPACYPGTVSAYLAKTFNVNKAAVPKVLFENHKSIKEKKTCDTTFYPVLYTLRTYRDACVYILATRGNQEPFLFLLRFTQQVKKSSPLLPLRQLHAPHVSIICIVSMLCALNVNPGLALFLPVQSNEHHLCLGMLAEAPNSPLCGWTGV